MKVSDTRTGAVGGATYNYTVPDDLWAELKHEGLVHEDGPTPRAVAPG
jgi:hypothetical protein